MAGAQPHDTNTRNSSSSESDLDNISMTRYGSTAAASSSGGGGTAAVKFASLKGEPPVVGGGDDASEAARSEGAAPAPTDPLLLGTKSHHHSHRGKSHKGGAEELMRQYSEATNGEGESVGSFGEKVAALLGLGSVGSGDGEGGGGGGAGENGGGEENKAKARLRRLAIDLSLYVNLLILLTKLIAYARTLSLSVLAALTDSVLDVVSQMVLNYTEKHSSLSRSSALYPAGAARLEPLGVLTCAALMGMASFEIIKESVEALIFDQDSIADDDQGMDSFWSMLAIVLVKLGLYVLCVRSAKRRAVGGIGASARSGASSSGVGGGGIEDGVSEDGTEEARNTAPGGGGAETSQVARQVMKVSDPTLEALAQDHWNDALSNAVAAGALLFALSSPALWFLDPLGAILISIYIIYSWYETGKEQIEQLTGKRAPDDFIDGIRELAANFDTRMEVDVVRAYHFGPKFLVEIEVVLPRDTLLFESHDLGMELQYEIEAMEDVERCFVHIDYETRPYDEHVVSKVPELREKIRTQMSGSSLGCHSV